MKSKKVQSDEGTTPPNTPPTPPGTPKSTKGKKK